MKKVLPFVPFVLLAVFFASLKSQPAGLQQLPEEGSQLVFMLVTAVVTWALLQLGAWFGIDLSGYIGVIASALAPILVTLIESYLQLIPPVFDNIVLTIIHLIVLLVGSLGTFWVFQRKPAPSLQ